MRFVVIAIFSFVAAIAYKAGTHRGYSKRRESVMKRRAERNEAREKERKENTHKAVILIGLVHDWFRLNPLSPEPDNLHASENVVIAFLNQSLRKLMPNGRYMVLPCYDSLMDEVRHHDKFYRRRVK